MSKAINRSPHLAKTIRRLAREGDVYCRIVVAQSLGRGLRLSAEDVETLCDDEAIVCNVETLAEMEDEAARRLRDGGGA